MFSWASSPRPIIALAPMAGYTDAPYRQIAKKICPRVVCFTEFTSVDGILHGNEATMRQVTFDPEQERPIVAQIFGKKPENFMKAARVLTQSGVDAIDINMGCPAKKIISSDHGSALLKNKSLAVEIVEATIAGTHLPVSVKMRIGTTCYDESYFFKFALAMEQAGVQLLTIHGRTSKQMYSGTSDWQPMYELKKLVKIPVIGNGDVKSGADAVAKLGTLDGLMIGRGSFGNPWVFLEIVAALEGGTFSSPTMEEKLAIIFDHLDRSCQFKGEKWGVIEMRKHFAHYLRGLPFASTLRQELMLVTTAEAARDLLSSYFQRDFQPAPILPPTPHALRVSEA